MLVGGEALELARGGKPQEEDGHRMGGPDCKDVEGQVEAGQHDGFGLSVAAELGA